MQIGLIIHTNELSQPVTYSDLEDAKLPQTTVQERFKYLWAWRNANFVN